jgi:DNA-binding beta-propeller fold protein YncE
LFRERRILGGHFQLDRSGRARCYSNAVSLETPEALAVANATLAPHTRSMPRCFRASVLILALTLPCTRSLRAQDSCNAPAKDAIVLLDVAGSPFEPVISADGCWLFVTLASPSGAGRVAVVRREAGALSVTRNVPVKGNPTGAVLTHDGRTLVVASGAYIAFLDVHRLESGDADPVIGYIDGGSNVGFIYANVTADDKTLFVAAENAQSVLVMSLERIRAGQFGAEAAIGRLDTGIAPISVTLSPDGRYLYTTSEVAMPEWKWREDCQAENAAAAARNGRGRAVQYHPFGVVMVFDVARAATDPAHALVSRVAAGCNPVRLVLSPDGGTAYVSARGEDALLAFDANRLVSDTAHARLGSAEVGKSPVGIASIENGTKIVVTNSDRFAGNGSDHQPLAVLDAGKLRAGGKKAVLGEIPAGGFPREIRVTTDGKTMFVTNFSSSTLEMIDLARAVPKAR